MAAYQCHQARLQHVQQLQSWFNTEQALLFWGGPGLSLAVSYEEFAAQIKLQQLESLVLTQGNELVAFGQTYVRHGRHHFGRLAVAPQHRGKRLAYRFIEALSHKALQVQQAQGFSLFVLAENATAKRTYQNCGFEVTPYPEQIPGGINDCDYMVAEELSIPSA